MENQKRRRGRPNGKTTDTQQILLRIDKKVLAELTAKAKEQGMTTNKFIKTIATNYIDLGKPKK